MIYSGNPNSVLSADVAIDVLISEISGIVTVPIFLMASFIFFHLVLGRTLSRNSFPE